MNGFNNTVRKLRVAKKERNQEDVSVSINSLFARLNRASKVPKTPEKKELVIKPIDLSDKIPVIQKKKEEIKKEVPEKEEVKEDVVEETEKEDSEESFGSSKSSKGILLGNSSPVENFDEKESIDIKLVDETFPLVKLQIKDKEEVFVNGRIYFNTEKNSLMYEVQEPVLSDSEKKILEEIKSILERKLNIEFRNNKSQSAFDYLLKQVRDIQKKIGLKLTDAQQSKFDYYIYRDFIGLGPIEPIMNDDNIEDISCDGSGVPIFIYHRNATYGGLETNIIFETKEEVDSFVLKLSQKTGKSISIAEPLLDGALRDGSRVQATYGSDIATRGSNFTIRKFSKDPVTPVKEIDYGTANPEILAYLWIAIENHLSILISGATATGKTSFLSAISLFIPPENKIVSIEDTPELRLPHPNWIPEVARSGFGRESYGEVSMFDLLKASLRQRPDYIIVGEVRGKEANVMFQSMATGHAGLGTLHADSFRAVYDRLTTKPIDLPASMLENLDLIVFLVIFKDEKRFVRRVKEIVEIIEYDIKTNQLVTNTAFRFNPEKNTFESLKSQLLQKIRERMGLSEEEIVLELKNRIKVIKWLHKNKINDYKEFYDQIKKYYSNKEGFIKEISE